jgi:hypothetical protein
MRYLCIDPRWPGGTPPENLLTQTIYSGVRFVVFPELWPQVGHYLELGLDVQLVIAKESGDPAQYFSWATSDWMRPRISWVAGNEPTSTGPSSWTMTPNEYRSLWQACLGLHGSLFVAGMADGDPANARPYLQPDAAGLSVHIYTLDPAQAAAKVAEYATLGVPVRVGETHPAGGYKMADYSWDVPVNDFCFSNGMEPGQGLFA